MLYKDVSMTNARRKYTREFKLEAVKRMIEQALYSGCTRCCRPEPTGSTASREGIPTRP